jgi:hypothetical protein
MSKIRRPTFSKQLGRLALSDADVNKDSESCTPLFSFEHLQDGYDVEACTRDERASLALKLSKISKLTWRECQQSSRHGLGSEKIALNSIRTSSIPSCIPEDCDSLLAFRFYAKAPMVGFRRGRIFYILWLDRDFCLYRH